MNLLSIIAILQSALALLSAVQLMPFLPDSIRQQAIDFSNQAVEMAIVEISKASYSQITESTPLGQQFTEPTIIPAQPIQTNLGSESVTPTSSTTITPFNPYLNKLRCGMYFDLNNGLYCSNTFSDKQIIIKEISFNFGYLSGQEYLSLIIKLYNGKIIYNESLKSDSSNAFVKRLKFNFDDELIIEPDSSKELIYIPNFPIPGRASINYIKFESAGELLNAELYPNR